MERSLECAVDVPAPRRRRRRSENWCASGDARVSTASPPMQSGEESGKTKVTAEAPQASLGTRVFQNTAAQLIGRVFGIGFSAATSILLARYLGKERLGEYGAIYAYLALYGFLASFCLEQILAREISVRRAQGAEIFRTATLTALGFS